MMILNLIKGGIPTISTTSPLPFLTVLFPSSSIDPSMT